MIDPRPISIDLRLRVLFAQIAGRSGPQSNKTIRGHRPLSARQDDQRVDLELLQSVTEGLSQRSNPTDCIDQCFRISGDPAARAFQKGSTAQLGQH